MDNPPCYKCTERQSKCHGNCVKYSEWKTILEKKKAIIDENKRQERECREHQYNVIASAVKRRKARNK